MEKPMTSNLQKLEKCRQLLNAAGQAIDQSNALTARVNELLKAHDELIDSARKMLDEHAKLLNS